MNKILTVLAVCFSTLLYFSGCDPREPDRTGGYMDVAKLEVRAADWRQIVTDSAFQPGDMYQMPGGYNVWHYGTYPNVGGTYLTKPLITEFGRQHLRESDYCASTFARWPSGLYSGEETTALVEICADLIEKNPNSGGDTRDPFRYMEEFNPLDMVIVTEPPDEISVLAEDRGIDLIQEPVCSDGFVFFTHPDNPVDSLTVEQIQGIYSGEITNWQEVGGLNEKIYPYQREEQSESQIAMAEIVMAGKVMLPLEKTDFDWQSYHARTVKEYKNTAASIGYTYRIFANIFYKEDGVKFLSVEGVAPTPENIQSGDYPFKIDFYAIIRKEDRKNTGGKFLNWLLTEEGQACLEQAGYVPLL